MLVTSVHQPEKNSQTLEQNAEFFETGIKDQIEVA